MKILIGIIIGVIILAIIATFSLYGRAMIGSVSDSIKDSASAEFDVKLAQTAVSDLRNELVRDNRSLLSLRRDIERTDKSVTDLNEQIERLAVQIQAGANLLSSGDEHININDNVYTRQQVESQVESYLSQRSARRTMLRQREEHLIALRQKLTQMESAVANKRHQIEKYESQIAMLEIDVRFQSNVDRYNVTSGNTEVQSIIDRLSDKVNAGSIVDEPINIDFINDDSDLQDRISEELGN